jgi:tRNA modification GTPase
VERLGIDRALMRAQKADLRVFLESENAIPDLVPMMDDIVVHGKADISGHGVSGKTGQGIPELLAAIESRLLQRSAGAGLMTRERHRQAIERAIRAMESVLLEVEKGAERAELAAAELRVAIRALETLVGRLDVEDLLDEIFSSFCIGK